MISPSQTPLPDNTQHSQQTNIHTPGVIRTDDSSRRAAVNLRLRPRGYWDRIFYVLTKRNTTLRYSRGQLRNPSTGVLTPCTSGRISMVTPFSPDPFKRSRVSTTLQSATTLKKANFLCHFSRVIIRKIYSWNIPGVFVLTPLEFKFVNTFQKTHSVSQYKVQVNILTNACTKWNTINRKKNHKIQFMVSTFRCFGTGVLSSGSLLKQRNTSTDRHDVIMKILKYWNSRIHMVRQV